MGPPKSERNWNSVARCLKRHTLYEDVPAKAYVRLHESHGHLSDVGLFVCVQRTVFRVICDHGQCNENNWTMLSWQ